MHRRVRVGGRGDGTMWYPCLFLSVHGRFVLNRNIVFLKPNGTGCAGLAADERSEDAV